MAKVRIIPAQVKQGNRNRQVEEADIKLKVAAYCRVSTLYEDQASSYETQVAHYKEFINKNPKWELAGIYADDGISGTDTKKRNQFNQMIDDAKQGKIDLIVTKSISRFARNTIDCLQYIRELKEIHVAVFFEKENINTMDAKGEVLITIMASLAQQESESISRNIKIGLQYRYQRGQVIVNTARFLGYDKDDDGNLVINPEQAKVVKRIFYECLMGKSAIEIARELTKEGIKNGIGRTQWHSSGIIKILRNEKYIGDALLQKTYTVDFLTKKRVKNDGQVPQYYVENNHPAIISRGLPSTKSRSSWICAERASQLKVVITTAILTPIAFPRLSTVVAARTSTPGAFGIDQGLARSKRSTSGAAIPVFTGITKENAAWVGQLLKPT